MTHVRVRFNGTANRYPEEIVNGNVVIRDYLEGKGAMTTGAHFTANAVSITNMLDMTFGELVERGVVANGVGIAIYETIKTSNA